MPQSNPTVASLDHLVLTVADLAKTVAFYERVLGMSAETFQTAQGETRRALRFGQMKINLHKHGAEFEPKAGFPTPGSADLCFLTDHPLDDWQRHLAQMSIKTEKGPVSRTGATGPLTSIYIRDPDQNLIEISVSRP